VLRAVNTLCAELRPHAGDLVEAFAVPEQWLGTIGRASAAAPAPAPSS
jgi:hypothetical protein